MVGLLNIEISFLCWQLQPLSVSIKLAWLVDWLWWMSSSGLFSCPPPLPAYLQLFSYCLSLLCTHSHKSVPLQMCLVLINSFNLDKYWAYSTFLYLKEILPDTFYMFKFHTVQRPISLHLIFHLKPCPISWVQLTPWNQKRRHTGRELHHLVAWQRRTTLKQKWNHNIPLTDRSQRSALQTSSTFDEQGLDWLNLFESVSNLHV